MQPIIKSKTKNELVFQSLVKKDIHPALATLWASRGIKEDETNLSLKNLIHFNQLKNIQPMANILANAIARQEHIVLSCDFDVDGCTAGAIAIRGLKSMGAERVDFAMPHRVKHGYGLSSLLVTDIHEKYHPDIILTVDCGVSSYEGINKANELGIKVLVTDHHLCVPNKELPKAACIVNPNQPDCLFPSKCIAGAGVIFYVMLAVRAELKLRGYFETKEIQEPNIGELLDLVALATIADVVKLDYNNRILVHNGLNRIRSGRACFGINAILEITKKSEDLTKIGAFDMGFVIGPRINAAGRLEDATMGVNLLLSKNKEEALILAQQLDALNKERREIELEMKETAEIKLEEIDVEGKFSLALFNGEWHQGVVGIVASRIKDKYNRPVIIFAKGTEGKLKGSGRSIPGFHLRDALDIVDKRNEGLIVSFGGHAMAAGIAIIEEGFELFVSEFNKVAQELLTPDDLKVVIEVDSPLETVDISTIELINSQIWGQGFTEPVFCETFEVISQSILKESHLKLVLRDDSGREFEAIYFFFNEEIDEHATLIYSYSINEYKGNRKIQLMIKNIIQD